MNFPLLPIRGSRENSYETRVQRSRHRAHRIARRGKNGGEIIEGVDPVLNSPSRSRLEAEKRIDVSMTKVLIGADL